jgi:hypothetical protein
MTSADGDFDADPEREIRELLAAQPRPVMPPEVLARIEAALAAEGTPATAPPAGRRWYLLAAAAAVAVLAGFIVIPRFSDTASLSTSSPQPEQAAAPVTPSPGCTALGTQPSERSTPVTDSGTAYTATALRAQAEQLLSAPRPTCQETSIQAYSADMASARPLRDCVMAVADGRSVLAVDLGWYAERPSVTLVLVNPREAVAVDCATDPATVLARAALR